MISLQYVCLNFYKCPNRIICQHLLVWWPWKARACGMQTSWQKNRQQISQIAANMSVHTCIVIRIYICVFIDLFVFLNSNFHLSRKIQVHLKDIHKFGKAPSLTTCWHRNDVWQTWGASLAGKNNDLLNPRVEIVLPFWSGIFAAGLWVTWRGATGRDALQVSFSTCQVRVSGF